MLERPNPNEDLPLLRGRSGILATAGLLIGLLSVALAFLTPASVRHIGPRMPPSLLALNLSFCAMLMGLLAIYRIRAMPKQALVRTAAIMALVLGLAGPVIYARQSLEWRVSMERTELANIREILAAVRAYAADHGGAFPPDLATLVKEKRLRPEALQSPYAIAPEYVYVGGGLKLDWVGPDSPLIVLHASEPRSRVALSVGFADGRAAFLTDQQTEAALQANNAKRASHGLPPLQPVAASQASPGTQAPGR